MEADVTNDGAVVLDLRVSVAGGLIHLVMSGPGEVDAGWAVVAIQLALHSTEDEFTTAVWIKLDVAGLHQVDEVYIWTCFGNGELLMHWEAFSWNEAEAVHEGI